MVACVWVEEFQPKWKIKLLLVHSIVSNMIKFRGNPKIFSPKLIQKCIDGLGENSRVWAQSEELGNPEPSF
jgi:hypothetical protein